MQKFSILTSLFVSSSFLIKFLIKIKKGSAFGRTLLIKVGDDLLSHNCSTIGAGGLNFSVRNGKRWSPAAIVT